MPGSGKQPRYAKRTSLLNDSKGRARARAPLGTPGHNNQQSTIKILPRPLQPAKAEDDKPAATEQQAAQTRSSEDHLGPDRRAQTPCDEPAKAHDNPQPDIDAQMSYFGDLASGSSFNFASEMRLPVSRKGKYPLPASSTHLANSFAGRVMEENEEPRSHNPVSLEDFIVHKQSGRNRTNRENASKAPDAAPSQTSQPPSGPAAEKGLLNLQTTNTSASALAMRPAAAMRPDLAIRTASTTSAPTTRGGSSLMSSLGAEFREQQHSNGDLSVHQWSEEEQKSVPVGRIGQGDVSYFVRFCERSIQDNQHDAQKMSLYREHILVMIRNLSEKRKQAIGSYSQPNSAAPSRIGTSASSMSPDARRRGPPTISGFGALQEDINQYTGDYALRRAWPTGMNPSMVLAHFGGAISQPPQTAIDGGAFPRYAGHQQAPVQHHPSALEERQQMYYEREQQYRAMQQQVLAQQDIGKKLTGYEPPEAAMAAHRQALEVHSFEPAQRSTPFAKMTGGVSEFVPKVKPPPTVTSFSEDTLKLSDLVATSTPLSGYDERLVARKEQERIRLEQSIDNDFEPDPDVNSKEKYDEELNTWFDSGRVDHEKTMKFSHDLLSAEGKLEDKHAQVAMPLMAALFKAFQSYDQSSRFQVRARADGAKQKNEQLDAYAKFTTPPKKAVVPVKPGEQPSLFSVRDASPSPSGRRVAGSAKGQPALPDISLISPQRNRTGRRDSPISTAGRSESSRPTSRNSGAGRTDRFGLPLQV